jgi:uncharacterized protein YkwD
MRRASIRLAFALTLVGLTGCGSASLDAPSPAASKPADPPARVASTAEMTDGRTGAATRSADSGASQQLAQGGPLDPSDPPADPNRRDGVGADDACADILLTPAVGARASLQAATLCLLNGERADRALPPLALNAKLGRAASAHATDMVARSYFAHEGANGSKLRDRVRATGYLPKRQRWVIGENLAWGTGTLATPKAIVNAWMNSAGHRANVLHAEYRDVGFGIVMGNPKSANGFGATYANAFGRVGDARRATTAATATVKRRAAAARRRVLVRRATIRRAAARRATAARRARSARAAAE